MTEETNRLGIIISGSLNKGVEVRLNGTASVEDMAVGRYVTISGRKRRFFGMITDVSLGVTDMQLTLTPPDVNDIFMTEVLTGTSTYGTLHVLPMLTISGDTESIISGPQPVKTIPGHFSPVKLSSEADIERVFGKEDDSRFYIGNPLDMETKLCLNLPEFVKRSNGIFGKSGTGKTFLTRILLIGMLQKGACVNLVFDMHSEYGWEGTSEKGRKVKALKQLFPNSVAVFTLDEENARRRRVSTDFVVRIGYDEIEPEDIALLRETLNLTVTTDKTARFPLVLRVPAWAEGATLRIAGGPEKPLKSGSFHQLERQWKGATEISLRFPMKVKTTRRYHGALAVERGPLVYSLKLGESWTRVNADKPHRELPHGDFEVRSTTPWNYGLLVNGAKPETSITFEEQPVGEKPFAPEGAGAVAKVKGRRLPGWKLSHGWAAEIPPEPQNSKEPVEELTLIPYGCTNIRITEFPQAG